MDKVAKETIDALMARVQFKHQVIGTSTFVYAFLDDQFYMGVGHSACVDPANFDTEIGKEIALRDCVNKVVDKLWEFEGYCLYKARREAAAE